MLYFGRMTEVEPTKFRKGDIVEAQLSFIAVPARDKYRMKTVLRSLAIIDSTHSEVCEDFLVNAPNSTVTSLLECPYCIYCNPSGHITCRANAKTSPIETACWLQ